VPVVIIGVAWGIVGGALPGISPSITMALLLPFTYALDPTSAVVLLASTYVGAEYGGSVPAILINTPGTNAAAATTIDGYAMKLKGKASDALGISLYSGVIGGIIGFLMLFLLTEPLVRVALLFTPPAYFALGLLGLSVIASLSGGSLIKSLAAALIGLMIATVGTDPISGVSRFTFGESDLLSGIKPILIMVGVFAVSELFAQSSAGAWVKAGADAAKVRFPNAKLRRRLLKPQLIGSGIGTFEGVMPGAGGTVAAFMSYNEARRWSSNKEEFGQGSPEGIAAPEAANNTVACTALVPMLSFGIPGSNATAVLLGGFLIHGLRPGPQLFQESSDVIFGLYGGLAISPFILLGLGMLLLPLCIWMVNRPKPYLMAFIYALIFSGVYSIHQSTFDLVIVLIAGVGGYFMRLFKMPFLPLVLGLVLGYMVESNYRRSLVLSGDDHGIFLRDPISLGFLILAVVFVLGSLFSPLLSRLWSGKGKKQES
jgi:putative tricarboxylic transport membrane protein